MPIYEYTCPSCGHSFEKRVSFSQADDPQPCPSCGNRRARKQISLIGGTSSGGGSRTHTPAAPSCSPVG
ncbi:MAG TPA: zinc ribbon domain-containing protein [Chloroflexi bacterium]|nr:zinc ribbon domain-containing protein [Chloroflexota bacterium]